MQVKDTVKRNQFNKHPQQNCTETQLDSLHDLMSMVQLLNWKTNNYKKCRQEENNVNQKHDNDYQKEDYTETQLRTSYMTK